MSHTNSASRNYQSEFLEAAETASRPRNVPDMRLNAAKELSRLIEDMSFDRPRRLLRNVYREAMNAVIEKYDLLDADRPLLSRMLCRICKRGPEIDAALGLTGTSRAEKFNRPARAKQFIEMGPTYLDDFPVNDSPAFTYRIDC